MSFDDHKVPRRSLEEIEAEANRCRARAPIEADGRIDVFGLLRAWQIAFKVKPDSQMGDDKAFSSAKNPGNLWPQKRLPRAKVWRSSHSL
jgi:hypothetical protein